LQYCVTLFPAETSRSTAHMHATTPIYSMIWMKYAVGVFTCNIYSGFMDLLELSRGTWKERFFNLVAQKHKEFAYPYMMTICFRPIASKKVFY
jgi:hypothetical protein